MPLNTIEYHSVSFSTIGAFNGISVGLSGTVNGNLKCHSIPLNGTKYHSNTIQIPFKWPYYGTSTIQWYLNGIFGKGRLSQHTKRPCWMRVYDVIIAIL